MDQPPQHLLPRTNQDKFLHLPYKERWEALKPIIIEFYTGRYGKGGKSTKMDELVAFMKKYYSFPAAFNEYPNHLRTWNVSKRIRKDDMGQIVEALARRGWSATSTALVSVREGEREKPVEASKLKRYLTDQKRLLGSQVSPPTVFSTGLLFTFHLPYSAYVYTLPLHQDHPSPFGSLQLTPSHIHVHSPATLSSPPSHEDAMTPNMQLVQERARSHRARLLLQGRQHDLLSSMCREDRRAMVDFLHDLFLHVFVMAKSWGPEATAHGQPAALPPPASPSNAGASPATTTMSQAVMGPRLPPQLCSYDDGTWHRPEQDDTEFLITPQQISFQESLRPSVVSGVFTSIPTSCLPIALEEIQELLDTNPRAMDSDAWRLAIMTSNQYLLGQLISSSSSSAEVTSLYPYHLAAAYLDGGRTTAIVKTLLHIIPPLRHNLDGLGHTILDALMISILRSHTSVDPATVLHHSGSSSYFPAEDKDICGRWDASTGAVRELRRQGHVRIPTSWKHVFCHTSVRAVCDFLKVIYGSRDRPDINTPSGLYQRRCTVCGIETRLGPLHSLIVTAFHLGQSGMEGETMLGVLTLALCLLALGADPLLEVKVSMCDILGQERDCQHAELPPTQLMLALPVHAWAEGLQTGWACLFEALVLAEKRPSQSAPSDSAYYESGPEPSGASERAEHADYIRGLVDVTHGNRWLGPLGNGHHRLGLLWAMIQMELSVYHRRQETDAWMSAHFSMKDIAPWLRGDSNAVVRPFSSVGPAAVDSPDFGASNAVAGSIEDMPVGPHINSPHDRDVKVADLFLAAHRGHAQLISSLVATGIDVSVVDSEDRTPLYIAALSNHPQCVQLLLSLGAVVNHQSAHHNGKTAWVEICGSAAHEQVAEILVAHGAQKDVLLSDGEHVLYQEAAGRHVEAVRTMLRRGMDPSFRTTYLWCSLHWAATDEIAGLLIDAGADVNNSSDTDKTPLDILAENGELGSTRGRLLMNAGAVCKLYRGREAAFRYTRT